MSAVEVLVIVQYYDESAVRLRAAATRLRTLQGVGSRLTRRSRPYASKKRFLELAMRAKCSRLSNVPNGTRNAITWHRA